MKLRTFIPILSLRVLNVSLSLLITLLAVRLLGAEATNLFYVLSLTFVIVPLITLGVPEAIVRNNSQPIPIKTYFPFYLPLASLFIALFFSSSLGGNSFVLLFFLTFSLSLSIYFSEVNRASGRFLISSLLNNSLLNIILLVSMVIAFYFQGINVSLIAAILLSFYSVVLFILGLRVNIKVTESLNSKYFMFSFRLMLATALASLWDNLDIIFIGFFDLQNVEEAIPILRLIRGYAFPGIVLGYVLAPQIGRLVNKEVILSHFLQYKNIGFLIVSLISIMTTVAYFFSESCLLLLFNSVSGEAVAWNKSIVLIQALKSLCIPFFIYINFKKPQVSIVIIALLVLLKFIFYFLFKDNLLLIYNYMGYLHVVSISVVAIIVYRKYEKLNAT